MALMAQVRPVVHQIAAVRSTDHGKDIRLSSSGCRSPRQPVSSAMNHNTSLLRILRHAHPLQSLWHLWVDAHTGIARLLGNDTAQGLIEPRAYAVEAVVQKAALAVPMLPSARATIVEHIEIAGIAVLFQHAVDPVGLMIRVCPQVLWPDGRCRDYRSEPPVHRAPLSAGAQAPRRRASDRPYLSGFPCRRCCSPDGKNDRG